MNDKTKFRKTTTYTMAILMLCAFGATSLQNVHAESSLGAASQEILSAIYPYFDFRPNDPYDLNGAYRNAATDQGSQVASNYINYEMSRVNDLTSDAYGITYTEIYITVYDVVSEVLSNSGLSITDRAKESDMIATSVTNNALYDASVGSEYESNWDPEYESNWDPEYESNWDPEYESNWDPEYESNWDPEYESNWDPEYESNWDSNTDDDGELNQSSSNPSTEYSGSSESGGGTPYPPQPETPESPIGSFAMALSTLSIVGMALATRLRKTLQI